LSWGFFDPGRQDPIPARVFRIGIRNILGLTPNISEPMLRMVVLPDFERSG